MRIEQLKIDKKKLNRDARDRSYVGLWFVWELERETCGLGFKIEKQIEQKSN